MANNIGLSTYTVDGDLDTWGDKWVADIAAINAAFGDTAVISNTSGTYTLTAAANRAMRHMAIGTGSALVTVEVIAGLSREWTVSNDRASGQIKYQVAGSGGAGSVTVEPGQTARIYSDGTVCAMVDFSRVKREINAQTGTSYTFVLADFGKLVTLSNAAAISATVPPASAAAFPVGTQIDIVQRGAGQVTFVAGTGVTILSEDSKLKIYRPYGGATLIKIDTNTWLLGGSLTT